MMDLSIPYYEDRTRLSNSAIGWYLNNGPLYFYKKLTGAIPDETGAALSRGTRIHEYILQPEEFYNDYIAYDGEKPSSVQQERFCDSLINSPEIEPDKAALRAYKQSYSIIGKSEEKMLSEGLKMANTLKSYIQVKMDGRELITARQIQQLEKIKEVFYSHKAAGKLLNDTSFEEHHEFHINWECGIPCKSLLDCVKFDYDNKICQIIDLKTTTKLWHFEDSIKQYDYLRQLCFYQHAVIWYLANEKQISQEELNTWTFEFYIIAIDGIDITPQVRVFKIPQKDVDSKYPIIQKTIENIKWHTDNNLWEHSIDYYNNDGYETLNLDL